MLESACTSANRQADRRQRGGGSGYIYVSILFEEERNRMSLELIVAAALLFILVVSLAGAFVTRHEAWINSVLTVLIMLFAVLLMAPRVRDPEIAEQITGWAFLIPAALGVFAVWTKQARYWPWVAVGGFVLITLVDVIRRFAGSG